MFNFIKRLFKKKEKPIYRSTLDVALRACHMYALAQRSNGESDMVTLAINSIDSNNYSCHGSAIISPYCYYSGEILKEVEDE